MIQDNFGYFESLQTQGYLPEQAYLEAKQQGLDSLAQIRMLRAVYHLSLPEAKNIMMVANHQTQDSNPNHNLIKVLKLVEQRKNWEFSQDSVGQWYWKSYSAAGGHFKTTTSTTSYSSLADCFANAKATGYDGGMVTETEIDRVRQLFKHNQRCSPDEVVYEDGDWYNYRADEGNFEKVDDDRNVFEIDSEGTLTYWGKSWRSVSQKEELACSHTDRITVNLPTELAKELSTEATQIGLSLSDYVLRVLVSRTMTTSQHQERSHPTVIGVGKR